MAVGDVVVLGAGMISAVGLSSVETAASVRSAVMRFAEIPMLDHRFQPFTMAEVPEDGLPPVAEALAGPGITMRERRMLRMASAALRECVRALPETAARPPLLLALPETRTARPLDGAAFLAWLAVQAPGCFDPARSEAAFVGRAGGLVAVGQAVEHILAGQATVVMAGGVDTFRDPYVLGTLDMEARVKSAVHLDGMIPGEGAAFLLLASRSFAASAGLAPLASVSVAARGFEPGHLYSEEPYRGDGLAATITQLIQSGSAPAPIAEVYSSMNGESHWAKEWGVAFLRNRSWFVEGHGMHHPADCYGDVGAAAGPLMAGLAALGIRDGYRRAPALVYASSDRGERAALVVAAA